MAPINPNSILAALWQSGVPGFPQPGRGGFGSLVAPQQGSSEINRQNSALGGMPFGIDPPTFRDDTGLVAHNLQLGRASQGGGDISDFMAGITTGAPPAYVEQGNPHALPSIFSQGAPPGGWFTLNDYYKQKPMEGTSADYNRDYGAAVPPQFQVSAGGPSTNDWRLLPPQYRDPNYFMIGGRMIDRRAAGSEAQGHGVLGLEGGTGDQGFFPSTAGAPWVPPGSSDATWPAPRYLGQL